MITTTRAHVVVGMAGHIDHGKTALVRALTGIDTDRLKEEKDRGMTTDLGFAFMGDDVAIIDVPGHERFVKTMVAGVNTVDIALLVVAADDGVMPQTREHLDILRILQIQKGLVIINKSDLVASDWLDMVSSDIRNLVVGSFLEGAPVIPVSAVSGEGIPRLADAIRQVARTVPARRDRGVFRMPIDRVFTIKGFGTVVAGTVLSGKVRLEETLELLPPGISVRVRGIQVHDRDVEESGAGLRTAINLHGIEKESIERGHVVAAPGYYTPTYMLDAQVCHLASAPAPLAHRTRVRIHLGTSEVIARAHLLDAESIRPGEGGLVQLHFEQPVVADHGDRFVMRAYSPVTTIGGGEALDPHPIKHRRFDARIREHLQRISQGDPAQVVLEFLLKQMFAPTSTDETARATSIPTEVCRLHLATLEQRSEVIRISTDQWFAAANIDRINGLVVETLSRFHRDNPLRTGIAPIEILSRIKPSPERILFEHVVREMIVRDTLRINSGNGRVSLATHRVQLSAEQEKVRRSIEKAFLDTALMPPTADDVARGAGKDGDRILNYLVESGDLIRMEDGIVMHRKAVENAQARIAEFFSTRQEGTLSELRRHLGITRKYAVPLMVYLDSIGFTQRDGEIRYLVSSRHPSYPSRGGE